MYHPDGYCSQHIQVKTFTSHSYLRKCANRTNPTPYCIPISEQDGGNTKNRKVGVGKAPKQKDLDFSMPEKLNSLPESGIAISSSVCSSWCQGAFVQKVGNSTTINHSNMNKSIQHCQGQHLLQGRRVSVEDFANFHFQRK